MNIPPFLKANFSMGSATAVRFILGIVKTKLAAVVIGAEGVGVIGLISQLQNFSVSLSSLSIANGLSRVISHTKEGGDPKATKAVLNTAFTLLLLFNVVFVIALLFSLGLLSTALLGQRENYHFLIPMLVSVPVHAFIAALATPIFFGNQRILDHTKASIIGALVEIILFVFLLRFYGIQGALWAIAAGLGAWLLSATYLINKFYPVRSILHLHVSKKVTSDLFSTASVMIVVGLVSYGTSILIRSHLIKLIGPDAGGIYHVAVVFSSLYMPFLTNAIWARFHPRVSAQGLTPDTKREWSEAILYMAAFGSVAQVGISCFSSIAIPILYTKEFLQATRYVATFMLGDYFFLLSQPCIAVFLARRQNKLYVLTSLAYSAVVLVGTFTLSENYGIIAASVSYLAGSMLIAFVGMMAYLRAFKDSENLIRNSIFVGLCLGAVILAFCMDRYGAGLWPRLLFSLFWGGAIIGGYFHRPTREKWFN